MREPAKILVVRNDRLGDFMLAYPTFLLLKQALPDSTIHALVPGYTREMALCCTGVDAVELDPGSDASTAEQFALLRRMRQAHYDAVLTLFSTTRIGWLTAAARIPYRLAPATKIAQLFYNRRLAQRRSRSAKPEYVYNLDLGMKLLADHGIAEPVLPTPPYLRGSFSVLGLNIGWSSFIPGAVARPIIFRLNNMQRLLEACAGGCRSLSSLRPDPAKRRTPRGSKR